MKKLIFVGSAAFLIGIIVATTAIIMSERFVHGRGVVVTLTKPMKLWADGQNGVGGVDCSAEQSGVVTLSPGTRLLVRNHGPVYWIELRASVVGKPPPFAASEEERMPVMTCGQW